MIKKSIPQNRLKELLHYNPDTGIFTNKTTRGIAKKGEIAGTLHSSGYIIIGLQRTPYRAHRLAFIYMTGDYPDEIDHDNHVRHDNRWLNLTNGSHNDNTRNIAKRKDNTSGINGVHWNESCKKWRVKLTFEGKCIHIGMFKCIREAAKARKDADIKYGFHKNHGS